MADEPKPADSAPPPPNNPPPPAERPPLAPPPKDFIIDTGIKSDPRPLETRDVGK